LAKDLESHNVKCWLDESEMKIGDSLVKKIRNGISNVDYFAVILSPNSIEAPWVINELDIAMNTQVDGKPIEMLPIILKECKLPGFLSEKFCGDFRDEKNYIESFKILIRSIGVVFNKNAMNDDACPENLGTAIDKLISYNLPLMSTPYHRPLQYIGMTVDKAETAVGGKANNVGNIIVENEECRMLLEAEGNFISYVDIDLKRTAPHNQNIEFDSESMLGALSISLSELELVRENTHFHTYYDHRKRLKVGVSCQYDGAPISVSFSSKYYGQ